MTQDNADETVYEPKSLCVGCGKVFDSFDELEAINGADGRDPRHFCSECAEKIRIHIRLDD